MHRIIELTETPAQMLANWREIREEIFKEFRAAQSDDQKETLLGIFKATMDLVEGTLVTPDQIPAFKEARANDYQAILTEEASVGGIVCVETLDRVTRREIAAGRMPPDSSLRQLAEKGLAAPHPTRAELLEQERRKLKASGPFTPNRLQSIAVAGRLTVTALPYLIVPWAVYRLNNGDGPMFWITLGWMLAARLFFALTEIAAEEFAWRVTRKNRVAAIVAYLKENNFPDPADKSLALGGDYLGYMGAVAIGETQSPGLRKLAHKERGFMKNIEPFQGFITRLRFHWVLDRAMKQYADDLEAARKKRARFP
jgi:hypothetical protein